MSTSRVDGRGLRDVRVLSRAYDARREGRTQTALKKIRASRPLDRDKVRQFFISQGNVDAPDGMTVTDAGTEKIIDDTLESLELDFTTFEYHNQPHRHFQIYPRGDK